MKTYDWVIFTQLKLCLATAIHNFEWVKITEPYVLKHALIHNMPKKLMEIFGADCSVIK